MVRDFSAGVRVGSLDIERMTLSMSLELTLGLCDGQPPTSLQLSHIGFCLDEDDAERTDEVSLESTSICDEKRVRG